MRYLSGILGERPIFLKMIDLGDEPARCGNPRVFQVFGVLLDMEDVEPVVSQIDAVMAVREHFPLPVNIS